MLGFLMIVSLFATVITLIGTIIVSIRKTGTWKKWIIYYFMSIIIFIISINLLDKDNTLNITLMDFKNKFNSNANKIKYNLNINENLSIDNGVELKTFQYRFTNNLTISGSINKNNKITEVFILGRENGTITSRVDIIMAMGILIMTISPELNIDERSKIIKKLLELNDNNTNLYNLHNNIVVNNKKYWINSSEKIGIAFGIINVNH